MLVNPEIYAWLNRQSKTEQEKDRPRPLVVRGGKINRDGPERTRATQQYEPEGEDRADEVEYLNERKSNYNFYA